MSMIPDSHRCFDCDGYLGTANPALACTCDTPEPTAFTPGPWSFHEQGDANEFCLLTAADGKWVISFRQNGELWADTQRANARLAATAPELDEALGSLVTQDLEFNGDSIVIRCASHGEAIERVRKARAVLAKGRGV